MTCLSSIVQSFSAPAFNLASLDDDEGANHPSDDVVNTRVCIRVSSFFPGDRLT